MTLVQADEVLRTLGYKPKAKESDEDGNYEVSLQTFIDGDMIGKTTDLNSTKPQCYKDLRASFDKWQATKEVQDLWKLVQLEVIDAVKTDKKTKKELIGTKRYTKFDMYLNSEFTEKAVAPDTEVETETEEDEAAEASA